MEKPVCRGECLFGKCPHKVCIKHTAGSNQEVTVFKEKMSIMTDFSLQHCEWDKSGYGIAVDIGTTTVAVFLYQLEKGEMLAVESQINAQVSFGPDVISRIKFCGDNADGLDKLHNVVINQLNAMIKDVCDSAGIALEKIAHAVITANTTMMHLLCKISPVSMGVLPFEPESYFDEFINAGSIGLNIKEASLYLPPCISSFVGADITTDMIAAGFSADLKGYYLLMDIGTNGEVTLGNREGIVASSTAAGPAFEGAHITCGMAGVNGAINSVYAKQGKLEYTTIGGGEAKGLCGSGLLDAIALFTGAGAINGTGKIVQKDNPYAFEHEGMAALRIAENVFLTQKDIREFQTAKAAVAAGVLTLMHDSGVRESDIDKLFLAGGFGNFMNIESARLVGLVPKGIETVSMGNGAAAGAAMLLLDNSYIQHAKAIKDMSRHVELGNSPYFMEKYVDCMYFE